MNIFSLISEIVAVLIANLGAIESLIASKNWVGLTEELITLVEQIVGSFQAKVEALDKAGVTLPATVAKK